MKKMILTGLMAFTALTSTPVQSMQDTVKLALAGAGYVGSIAHFVKNGGSLIGLGLNAGTATALIDLIIKSKSVLIKGTSNAVIGYSALAMYANLFPKIDSLGFDKTGAFLYRLLCTIGATASVITAALGTKDIINGIAEKFESEQKQDEPCIVQDAFIPGTHWHPTKTYQFYEALHERDLATVKKCLAEGVESLNYPRISRSCPEQCFIFNPLMMAISNEDYDCVMALLQAGADVNLEFFGTSPLHNAVRKQNFAIIKLLIEYGANINKCDIDCRTPYDLAIYGSCEIVNLLAEHANYKK